MTIEAVPARHPWRWVAAAGIAVLAAMFAHMLATNDAFQWRFMAENMFRDPVLAGVRTAIVMTVLAMALGIVLGIATAVLRLSPNPLLSGAAWLYTWFFRAVPRLVLLVTFGSLGALYQEFALGVPFDWLLFDWLGWDADLRFASIDANTLLSAFMAGLLGLGLSEGAYMAEIVRAGILAVDQGQTEAALALGMRRRTAMRRIVLPQALRVIIPPTGNEAIAMLKDTSLLSAIPLTNELFFQLSAVGARTFQVVPMLVAACLWYLALTSVLMGGQHLVERRLSRSVVGATGGGGRG